MEFAKLYPQPARIDVPQPQAVPAEPVLDKKASEHWGAACRHAPQLEDLAWRNLGFQAKPHPQTRQIMARLGAARQQITRLCAQLDAIPAPIRDQVERLQEDSLEVGQELVQECGIQGDQDHAGIVAGAEWLTQGESRQRAKVFFDAVRRRFDPRTDLPEDLSPWAAAYEIERRMREEGRFFFTDRHREYAQLDHAVIMQMQAFVGLMTEMLRNLPKSVRKQQVERKRRRV